MTSYNPKDLDPAPEQSSVRGKKKMEYNPKRIEKIWMDKWLKDKIYEPDLDKAKKPFYNLMMFPYPSAEGLHAGNMYAYTGADIYGRKKRMEGFSVFEPIGLDGFGIHSENYALKIGKHPNKLAKESKKNFYNQLQMIGNGFSWEERLETYDPEYYKWTQWIFVQMFKKGLAYRKKAIVNWCSECSTVLADEQVLAGECERCATNVIKKELEQWFFKITNYAEHLLNDLKKIDWSERVKIAQKNWIGRSEGAMIKFPIPNSQLSIDVFTTRPDTLFGATYIVLSPEHELIGSLRSKIENLKEVEKYIQEAKNRTEEDKEKTGVELKGVKAVNPATKEEIPIWIADYVVMGYGTGAIMAVPASDPRDFEFARKFELPIKQVISKDDKEAKLEEAYEGEGILINSGKFNGLKSEEAKKKITEFVDGKTQVNYHLRDWLISRQRYWGPPIPMIYCGSCDWQPVPEKDLPVLLPDVKDFHPTGTDKSPLATIEEFVKTKCPKCRGEARHETDVSDTFLDSAWYFFRYIDHKNKKKPFDELRAKKWLPVDMYIGGAEHAVLHLLYTRFLTKVFNEWDLIDFDEPFKKFRAHGLLIKDGAKMSKSRGNVVNLDEYIKAYGADVLRMYLMFLGPFDQGGDFRDTGINGIDRFLKRVWYLKENVKPIDAIDQKTETLLHQSIKKIGEDIEHLHYNTAVSQLMILLNKLEEGFDDKSYKVFLQLAAPFAPFITEELWHQIGEKESVHTSPWPAYDESKLKELTKEIVVQINGKVRDRFEVAGDINDEDLKTQSLAQEKVKNLIGKKKPQKIIVVKNRLVNIVID